MNSPTAALLNSATVPDLMRAVTTATATGAARLAAARTSHSVATHDELKALVDQIDLNQPVGDLDVALDELDAVWLQHAVWFHLPATTAHLNCPVVVPAVAADALAATVNTSLDTWDQSTSATLIERKVLSWTAERIGFPSTADGMFTPGGTTSTLQALMIARDEALEATAGFGHCASRPARAATLRIFTSAHSHFSVMTAAKILGLDDDAVVSIPVDGTGRMRTSSLRAALEAARGQGLVPMAVVATAGTTDRGAVDQLSGIGFVCQQHNVWLHVDAAYGSGLLTSRAHWHRLMGIELADSVTVDFHKTWFQPVSCSAVIVRQAATLRHCTHHADYLNPADTPEPNQVDRSLQTTRRFDALKIWLTLRTVGADGIGQMVDQVIDLAQQSADLLRSDGRFELVCEPSLSTVLFRWLPSDRRDPDQVVRAIRRRIWEAGGCTVAETRLEGRPCLKLTLLNPTASVQDVAAVMDEVHAAGTALTATGGTSTEPVDHQEVTL